MNDSAAQARQQRQLRLQGVREHRPRLGPQTVHFDIANGCNVRCTTCWHHSPLLEARHTPTAVWKRKQMPFTTFCQILDDLIELGGLEQIILSGMGDPSLNDALVPMVRYAHRHGIGVTIITNLLQVDLPRLLEDGPAISAERLNLLVSVCGVSERVWNQFHAMDQGFDQLLAQLQRLKRAEFRPKHVQVINSQNVHELVDMVRFADAWPARRINFKLASLAHGTEGVALSDIQRKELTEQWLPRAKAVATFMGIETDLDAFSRQIHDDPCRTAPIENVGCYMGTVYCRVTVDLEVLYCCNTDVSVGFLDSQTSFRSLWLGESYQKLRERLGRGDFFKSCQQCGKYKQNLKWAQKLDESERSLQFAKARPLPVLDRGECDS